MVTPGLRIDATQPQLVTAVELVINEDKKDQRKQNAGQETDPESVVPGQEGPLLSFLAQVGVAVFTAAGAGGYDLPAEGAANGFFGDCHGASMERSGVIDQQKSETVLIRERLASGL